MGWLFAVLPTCTIHQHQCTGVWASSFDSDVVQHPAALPLLANPLVALLPAMSFSTQRLCRFWHCEATLGPGSRYRRVNAARLAAGWHSDWLGSSAGYRVAGQAAKECGTTERSFAPSAYRNSTDGARGSFCHSARRQMLMPEFLRAVRPRQ